jgi:hypothetical protein
MARQIIKTAASRFKNIQEGNQTCVLLKNDRLWSTYDELWFVECNRNEQPTGKVVRCRTTLIEFNPAFDEVGHSILSLRPLGAGLEALPIETTTREVIARVTQESYETLCDGGQTKTRGVVLTL